jgi:hypothetical protein
MPEFDRVLVLWKSIHVDLKTSVPSCLAAWSLIPANPTISTGKGPMFGVTIDFGRRRVKKTGATHIIFETADVRRAAPCT